jgi:hypothetical protein
MTPTLLRLETGIRAAINFFQCNNAMKTLIEAQSAHMEPSILEAQLHQQRYLLVEDTQARILTHCASISWMYALFEQFCEAILGDWIDFRSKDCLFSDLPEKMQEGYKSGLIMILSNLSNPRYGHLSENNLIANYDRALNNERGFTLTPECLTHHKNNLRWPDLLEIFGRCGIGDLEGWAANHPLLTDYFDSPRKIVERLIRKLSVFIQYRNEAAHGKIDVDQILGLEDLEDYANFLIAVCAVIDELVRKHKLQRLDSMEVVGSLGSVSESLSNHIMVGTIEGVSIKVGDYLYLLGERRCVQRQILSLQLSGVEQVSLVIAKPTEVGIKLDGPVVNRARIYRAPHL